MAQIVPKQLLKERSKSGALSRGALAEALRVAAGEASPEKLNALAEVIFRFVKASKTGAKVPVKDLKPRLTVLLNGAQAARRTDFREAEIAQGAGLGQIISKEEGAQRLASFVQSRSVEEWAGKVLSATEAQQLGIPRTTLSAWRKRGAIIGLKKDMRNFVYPLEQFVDCAPVEGLKGVLEVAPNERAAWLWMRQPHAALNGLRPIDRLREGDKDSVAKVAARDFA